MAMKAIYRIKRTEGREGTFSRPNNRIMMKTECPERRREEAQGRFQRIRQRHIHVRAAAAGPQHTHALYMWAEWAGPIDVITEGDVHYVPSAGHNITAALA